MTIAPLPLALDRKHPRGQTGLLSSLLAIIVLAVSSPAAAQGVLENPAPDSRQSGIGVVSGWKCEAGELSLSFDGMPSSRVAYGTSREDTRSVCGDADNGFSYLINWNLLGDGPHTLTLYDDGVAFATATFEVVTMGTPFIRNTSGTKHVVDFPALGEGTTLQWQEGAQNFIVSDWVPNGTALVRYRGNVTCGGLPFTSSIATSSGTSWTSINGATSAYQRVRTDASLAPRVYSDDAFCSDPVLRQNFSLQSGRRYTLQWQTASSLELINDDEASGPTNVPCFVAGTLVMTPAGEVPIEALMSGDLVSTPDGSWSVVTEVRETPVGSAIPMVAFERGSIAPGVPSRRTVVTQDHRIGTDPEDLLKGWEFCGRPGVTCNSQEVPFVYNLLLDSWSPTFIANGIVAEALPRRDWR